MLPCSSSKPKRRQANATHIQQLNLTNTCVCLKGYFAVSSNSWFAVSAVQWTSVAVHSEQHSVLSRIWAAKIQLTDLLVCKHIYRYRWIYSSGWKL